MKQQQQKKTLEREMCITSTRQSEIWSKIVTLGFSVFPLVIYQALFIAIQNAHSKICPRDWQKVSMRWHFSYLFSVCYHTILIHRERERIDREEEWSSKENLFDLFGAEKLKVKRSLIPGSLHLYINWLEMCGRLPNIHKKL